MGSEEPVRYDDVERCVDDVVDHVGKRIVLGLPLGLGKPNPLVNALYQRAKADPTINLTISTALSLERPGWSNDLERRFMQPFVERMFGGYVDLDYIGDMKRNQLPDNIHIREFYAKAGAYLNIAHAQQNYVSCNYTHAYRDLLDSGVNVVAQLVSPGVGEGGTEGGSNGSNGGPVSLSCNPDVTLDVAREMQRQRADGRHVAILAMVNPNLPFMYGDAAVDTSLFTGIIDNPDYYFRLFGAPKMAVTPVDYLIGLHASTLIKDGGTLQIGIGSLGDALCYGLTLRQQHNEEYRQALERAGIVENFWDTVVKVGGAAPLVEGVSGSTEMLVDGYLHLMQAGVVKRKTYNDLTLQRLANDGRLGDEVTPELLDAIVAAGGVSQTLTAKDVEYLQRYGVVRPGWRVEEGGDGSVLTDGVKTLSTNLTDPEARAELNAHCLGDRVRGGVLIHGGFFLGPESFYDSLRKMSEDERRQINMTSVLNVNQLYGGDYASEELKRAQRQNARFVNACLMVTISGAAVSDGLDTGQMVSGVGGQYNFVSQAHALEGARSILMCKATRSKGREVSSNIVFNYGHITIPRHLRDIYITEYGMADLRGKSDREIIVALLNITDSRFQSELLGEAKQAGKIEASYEIPDGFRSNLPERIGEILAPAVEAGHFGPFPFGCDFTREELVIGKALKTLKARMSARFKKVSSLGHATAIRKVPAEALPMLERLDLTEPKNTKERMMRKLVVYALRLTGAVPK
jgi:acyl-CoA hydrolase